MQRSSIDCQSRIRLLNKTTFLMKINKHSLEMSQLSKSLFCQVWIVKKPILIKSRILTLHKYCILGFHSSITQSYLGYMKKGREIRILAFSDTHSMHEEIEIQALPAAHICIHAGDFTMSSEKEELAAFRQFVSALPVDHKIAIPGNHDFIFDHQSQKNQFSPVEAEQERKLMQDVCHFLEFEMIEVEGLTILGISKGPEYFDWKFSFAKTEGQPIIEKYRGKVDILVTHYPPYGVLDQVHRREKAGSKGLLEFVKEVKPKVHIFGHIHQRRGHLNQLGIDFYNASNATRHYECVPEPLQICLEVQIDEPQIAK